MTTQQQLGELVLAPKNKTLFSCDHAHILHMPYARLPYKLLSFTGVEPRIASFEMHALLVYNLLMRRVAVCDCTRSWAMLRGLKKAAEQQVAHV